MHPFVPFGRGVGVVIVDGFDRRTRIAQPALSQIELRVGAEQVGSRALAADPRAKRKPSSTLALAAAFWWSEICATARLLRICASSDALFNFRAIFSALR